MLHQMKLAFLEVLPPLAEQQKVEDLFQYWVQRYDGHWQLQDKTQGR